jgi:hypothetical protein
MQIICFVRSCRWRLGHDDDLLECGHERAGERGVPLVAHVACQVVSGGESQGEDVTDPCSKHE